MILASLSPRRAELLARLDLAFEICAPTCDEEIDPVLSPSEMVRQLAKRKAFSIPAPMLATFLSTHNDGAVPATSTPAHQSANREASAPAHSGAILSAPALAHQGAILAADTLVTFRDTVFGKPTDAQHARDMLLALSGQTHDVFTGLCLRLRDGSHDTWAVGTRVTFAPIPPPLMEEAIADGLDKAGAYGIQGVAARFTERIEGCFFNVMGLPLSSLQQKLMLHGLLPMT